MNICLGDRMLGRGAPVIAKTLEASRVKRAESNEPNLPRSPDYVLRLLVPALVFLRFGDCFLRALVRALAAAIS